MTVTTAPLQVPRSPTSEAVLVGLLSSAIMFSYVDRGLLAVSGPMAKPELGLSATHFGLAVSAFFWVYAPVQLFCGWMVDRFSPAKLFAGGLVIWSLATGLSALAYGLASLIALRMLLGLGQGFCFPGSSKIIAGHCRGETRGTCNGVVMAGIGLGQAIAAGAGGLVMAAFGWRAMYLLFAALTLLWLLPWGRVRLGIPQEARAAGAAQTPLGSILRHRALHGACLGHFCNNYGLYFLMTWMPLYLVGQRGMTVAQMAVLTGSAFVMQMFGSLTSGWVSDRLTAGGMHEGTVRKAIMVLANLVKGVAIVAVVMAESQMAMMLWLTVATLMMGLTNTQNFAVAQLLAGPHASGRWVGTQNFAANLAGIAGPISTGLILDATQSYHAAFWTAGLVTGFSALAWGILVPRVEPIDWKPAAR